MKAIAIALIILVAALGIWLFVDQGIYTDADPGSELSAGFKGFRDADFSKVAKIVLKKGEATAELTKTGDSWVVASLYGCPADQEKIDKIIEGLGKIETGAEVGRRAASHEKFEVGADGGALISCFNADGTALPKLIVGKTATGGSIDTTRVFVRFGEEEPTFRVESDIRSSANLWGDDVEAKNYLEKELFALDESLEIQTVRIARAEHPDLLVERRYRDVPVETPDATGADGSEAPKEPQMKSEEYFVVTSGTETHEVADKKYTAEGVLNRPKTVMIDDAVEPKERSEYGLDSPQMTVTVQYRKKGEPDSELQTLKLLFGNAKKDEKGEDKDYYFALDQGDSGGLTYLVRDYRFTGWHKKLEDFMPDPEKPEDAPTPGTPIPGTPIPGTPIPETLEPVGSGDAGAATAPPEGEAPVVEPQEPPKETLGPEEPPADAGASGGDAGGGGDASDSDAGAEN